jgi:predicted amidohydrolase
VENGVFGVACNYCGSVRYAGVEQRFPGGALAVGPAGETLGEGDGSGMLVVELRNDALSCARSSPEYLYRFRRPEIYGSLLR